MSKHSNNLSIDGYSLVMTCEFCPEQYDVFTAKGSKIGYIRIRHCGCELFVPDENGICIFDCDIMGMWNLTNDERIPVLTRVIDCLNQFVQKAETTALSYYSSLSTNVSVSPNN